ncbi:MAG: DNA polymerase III subunit gamma/tau [Pyrinomonadaceae bacterium]
MSYQVIARKWRPKTFDEVTGQEHITRTLRNAIEHDRLHHAYLFSGARGVGKTTTARLLAKALNCRKTDKANVFPCDTSDADACPSCIEISESRSIDVFEFDAASNTQVEKIREIILESINVAPARDRYKIFIIDEVHMLSQSSFNALLKTVEEPPPQVVFIMATTVLHKVPDTILSRCQQFEFRTISNQKIFDRLKLIADAEGIPASDDALREIARSGEGSMRDAQSNFDQVISFSGEKIGAADVSAALGIAGSDMIAKVLRAIADKQPLAALEVVDELITLGHDLRNFARDLLGLFRDLLVFKVGGGTEGLIESSIFNAEQMREHSAAFSESDFLRFFNSLAETESKLKEATQQRYVLEIGLVKLIEMRHSLAIEDVIARLSLLEKGLPEQTVAPANTERARTGAAQEKKTLIPEIKPPAAVEELPEEPKDLFRSDSASEIESETAEKPPDPTVSKFDLSFLDSMPTRLSSIEAGELEHVDDTWLDNAFELKLMRSGDDLGRLPEVSQFLKAAENTPSTLSTLPSAVRSNGNGSAAAIAADFTKQIPEPEEISTEIPELPENPTYDQLLAYAQSHPLVRQALRVFRGKIVGVNKA